MRSETIFLLSAISVNCAPLPLNPGLGLRQRVLQSVQTAVAGLVLGGSSRTAFARRSAPGAVDLAALAETVNAGRVYVHDNFLSVETVAELRADVDAAASQGCFVASGLSNRAEANQRFSSSTDRSIAPVLGTSGWTSKPLRKVDARMRRLREDLASSLARPSLADDGLPHEMYYSQSTAGALLPRHLDERHEELKGRKGWIAPSRRSLSWLLYLSDDNWDCDEFGGQLRTFPVAPPRGGGLVNARFGGAHDGNLQIAWRLDLANKLHPVYLDSFKGGVPVCGLYIVNDIDERQREWITRDFEVRDGKTGLLDTSVFRAALLPEYAQGSLLLIEDTERWAAGESPAGSRVEEINPSPGRLVLFDSVLLPHEVAAVKKGLRRALAGWMHESSPSLLV